MSAFLKERLKSYQNILENKGTESTSPKKHVEETDQKFVLTGTKFSDNEQNKIS